MLPFPRAPLWVLLILALTFVAFAPSYFLVLDRAPLAHHIHGITATLWILLLAVQGTTIHRGWISAHRAAGMASFVLAAAFTIGGLLVTKLMLERESPFNDLFGHELAVADVVATVAFLMLYGLALRHRRNVAAHARYMHATLFLLFGPALSRLLSGFMPGYTIRSVEELPRFAMSLDTSLAVVVFIILVLIVRDRRHNQPLAPYLVGLVSTLMMWAGWRFFGQTEAWDLMADLIIAAPAWLLASLGAAASMAVTWAAWTRPIERRPAGKPQSIGGRPASDPA